MLLKATDETDAVQPQVASLDAGTTTDEALVVRPKVEMARRLKCFVNTRT